MNDILQIILNNGVAIGMLCYFIYRDNKYLDNLTKAITELQDSIKELKNHDV